jgi:pyruvate kinase
MSRMSHYLDENRILGELMVSKGLVTRDQVESALFIQTGKPHLRLGEILMSMGLITIEQLDRVLREHLAHQFIGSLLLSNGFISQEQLGEAMAIQDRTGERMGAVIVGLGYVTQDQLERLLERQSLLRRPAMSDAQRLRRHQKRTKLVATVGPSCNADEMLRALMAAGVNVFRLNFSHGEHAEHRTAVERIRQLSGDLGHTIAILQDIQGPKIRIGEVEGGEVTLAAGSSFTLQPTPCLANAHAASVTYPRLLEDVKPGATVLLDDGRIELAVEDVSDTALRTRVKVGGPLRPRKGVNFPGSTLGISILTEKDRADLAFGAQIGVDWVAASFVQRAADVLEVKQALADLGRKTPVIAKIERREAVYNLQEILGVADGVMVARGDLGVEMNAEDVPLIQKQIIRQANIYGRPVITATQMLDSMIHAPRPTRAEASDVANAILDGTDAVMLSNETAAGKYPLEAATTMATIIEKTEQLERPVRADAEGQHELAEALTSAACQLASEVNAAAIIVPSFSGATARLVSRFRPRCVILSTSSSQAVCRQMALHWGLYPLHVEDEGEVLRPSTVEAAVRKGLLMSGDLVVVMQTVTNWAGRSRGLRIEQIFWGS